MPQSKTSFFLCVACSSEATTSKLSFRFSWVPRTFSFVHRTVASMTEGLTQIPCLFRFDFSLPVKLVNDVYTLTAISFRIFLPVIWFEADHSSKESLGDQALRKVILPWRNFNAGCLVQSRDSICVILLGPIRKIKPFVGTFTSMEEKPVSVISHPQAMDCRREMVREETEPIVAASQHPFKMSTSWKLPRCIIMEQKQKVTSFWKSAQNSCTGEGGSKTKTCSFSSLACSQRTCGRFAGFIVRQKRNLHGRPASGIKDDRQGNVLRIRFQGTQNMTTRPRSVADWSNSAHDRVLVQKKKRRQKMGWGSGTVGQLSCEDSKGQSFWLAVVLRCFWPTREHEMGYSHSDVLVCASNLGDSTARVLDTVMLFRKRPKLTTEPHPCGWI